MGDRLGDRNKSVVLIGLLENFLQCILLVMMHDMASVIGIKYLAFHTFLSTVSQGCKLNSVMLTLQFMRLIIR